MLFGKRRGRYTELRIKNKDSAIGQDVWKLQSGTTRSGDPITANEEAPSYFIQACSSNGEKEVSGIDSGLYKEVLEFCTRDASIKDGILDSGKSLIGNEDEVEGKRTWKLYREKNKNVAKGSDTGKISDWDPSTTSDDTVLAGFKTGCTNKLEIKSSSSDFDVEYPLVFAWCTK